MADRPGGLFDENDENDEWQECGENPVALVRVPVPGGCSEIPHVVSAAAIAPRREVNRQPVQRIDFILFFDPPGGTSKEVTNHLGGASGRPLEALQSSLTARYPSLRLP